MDQINNKFSNLLGICSTKYTFSNGEKNNMGWTLDEDDLFDDFFWVNIFKTRVHEWQTNRTKVKEK